jgi:UDP-N-acetyl-D-glucosamine dehydrogenase
VIGQGHVGLPLALRAAEAGHQVIGYDTDSDRITRLTVGDSYLLDISPRRIREAQESGTYHPSHQPSDLDGFDAALITVPTPLRDGTPDLRHIEDAGRTLAEHLRPGALVVLESTTYPGTTRDLLAPLLHKHSGLVPGHDFHLGYSPERLDPGNAHWHLANTPKVVSGINAASLNAVSAFYATFIEKVIPVPTCEVAELTKLLENTFRHVNIALVNELSILTHDLGIDLREAIDAAATKPFGYQPFAPGPGVGGHCLPVDPSYLSWSINRRLGQRSRFIELANDINIRMPDYVIRRLTDALNARHRPINGSRILLLGLTYKANTADTRNSPALRIAHRLTSLGAHVRAADPHLHDQTGFQLVQPTPHELATADAVVLLTDHDAFDYPSITTHARYILDCRGRLARPVGPTVEPL